MLHIAVLSPTETQLKWSANPYLFAVYGGMTAGISEEMGHFFASIISGRGSRSLIIERIAAFYFIVEIKSKFTDTIK